MEGIQSKVVGIDANNSEKNRFKTEPVFLIYFFKASLCLQSCGFCTLTISKKKKYKKTEKYKKTDFCKLIFQENLNWNRKIDVF